MDLLLLLLIIITYTCPVYNLLSFSFIFFSACKDKIAR